MWDSPDQRGGLKRPSIGRSRAPRSPSRASIAASRFVTIVHTGNCVCTRFKLSSNASRKSNWRARSAGCPGRRGRVYALL